MRNAFLAFTLDRAALNLTQDARSIFLVSHRFCAKPVPTFAHDAQASLLVPATPLIAQNGGARHEQGARERHDNDRHDRGRRDHQSGRRETNNDRRREISRYDYNRPDPRYGNYHAERYYVASNRYQARRLNRDDRIYRGSDNRYYCRRSDGTTGLIIGGLAGGALGNVIAPGGSKTLGTLLGGGLGALLGRSVDRDGGNVTCR